MQELVKLESDLFPFLIGLSFSERFKESFLRWLLGPPFVRFLEM